MYTISLITFPGFMDNVNCLKCPEIGDLHLEASPTVASNC